MSSHSSLVSPSLLHVVFFKFKSDTTQQQIDSLHTAFLNLTAEFPSISGFKFCPVESNVLYANLPQGLEGFSYFTQFKCNTEEDLRSYFDSEGRKKLVENFVKPIRADDGLFVFDFKL